MARVGRHDRGGLGARHHWRRRGLTVPVARSRGPDGPGYRWGTTGKLYRYTPGDPDSRRRARTRAERQGRAIERAQARRDGIDDPSAAEERRRLVVSASWEARMLREIRKAIRPGLRIVLGELREGLRQTREAEYRRRLDADDGWILAAVQRALSALLVWRPDMSGIDGVGEDVASRATDAMRWIVRRESDPDFTESRLAAIDVAQSDHQRALLRQWSEENATYITRIPAEVADRVAHVVATQVREGTSVQAISKMIQRSMKVGESRARLIARTETARLNSMIHRQASEAAGAARYRWRTSEDQRVRPMHRALNNTEHSWDDPPITNKEGQSNNPGEDYQCRCVAIPLFDDEADF